MEASDPDPQSSYNKYFNYNYFVHFSLAEFVRYKAGHFNTKKLYLEEGTPLPATFSFAKGLFTFIVQRDLSVTFNGTK
jgi:hypothetical protein